MIEEPERTETRSSTAPPLSLNAENGGLSDQASAIREMVERHFPDHRSRNILLSFLGEAIDFSHAINPNVWVLWAKLGRTPADQYLVLFTGWIWTFMLSNRGLSVRVTKSMLRDDQRQEWSIYRKAEKGQKLEQWHDTYEFPAALAAKILGAIREPFFASARGNLTTNKSSQRRGLHTPEALEYLELALGRSLPRPAYQADDVENAAWKVSSSDMGLSAKRSRAEGVTALAFLNHKDVSTLPRDSFEEFLAAIPSTDIVRNHGPAQLWSFSQEVSQGDRIYLYEGGAIRGVGTISGDYSFVPDHPFPHQRNVIWEDVPNLSVKNIPPQIANLLISSYSTLEPIDTLVADELDRLLAGEVTYERLMPEFEGDWRDVYARVFEAEGLKYTAWQRAVFFTALQTKGFVILSGISGTGKTRIAQAFAEALPAPSDARTVEFLTVRPDWRDSKSLLGYHNPITEKYEWTAFLRFLMRAKASWEARDGFAYFVILDEMNLAHVEHYFADLLSIIESGRDAGGWSREPIRLGERHDEDGPPAELKLPPNLAVIGTVNLDETTHAFSPKVLDRAFAIELSDVSFDGYKPGARAASVRLTEAERWALLNAFSGDGEFARIDRNAAGHLITAQPHLRDWMQALNSSLRPYHKHFGYRVFDEVMAFVDHAQRNGLFASLAGESEAVSEAFDAAVLMKVLPKFHGSRQRLEAPLSAVIAWCQNPENPDLRDVMEIVRSAESPTAMETQLMRLNYRLRRTAHRAVRLLWIAHTEGFAAFG